MDGLEYEEACAQYLAGLGYKHIERTVATGDQGVDIIAQKDGLRYAFQCKYYSSPVGNFAVQEVYAGCAFYDCDMSVVISNNTFTRSAIELADKIGVELWPETVGVKSRMGLRQLFYLLFHLAMLAAATALVGRRIGSGPSALFIITCAAGLAAPSAALIRRSAALEFAMLCYAVTGLLCLEGCGPVFAALDQLARSCLFAACLLAFGTVLIRYLRVRAENRRN